MDGTLHMKSVISAIKWIKEQIGRGRILCQPFKYMYPKIRKVKTEKMARASEKSNGKES